VSFLMPSQTHTHFIHNGKHVYQIPQMNCPQILYLFPCNSQWFIHH